VTSINRHCTITIKPSLNQYSNFNAINIPNSSFSFSFDKTNGIELLTSLKEPMLFAYLAIMQVVKYLNGEDIVFRPLDISAETSDFYLSDTDDKLGLGSSAAFSTSLLKALFDSHGVTVPLDDIFEIAREIHFSAQGKKGSGIDIAASVFGGVLEYKISSAPTGIIKVEKNKNLKMIFVWSGCSVSTVDMLTELDAYQQANPQKFSDLIKKMTSLSDDACKYYSAKQVTPFLENLENYFYLLKQLGDDAGLPIISREHQEIASMVESVGAVYKPSGAGGGDMGIAFCRTPDLYDNLTKLFEKNNIQTIELAQEELGVHRVSSNQEPAFHIN